jgi:uncharacterized protein YutE (UPF0331/DUF86 family)
LIQLLVRREVLPYELAKRIENITHYRNLVIHGERDNVEDEVLTELIQVEDELNRLTNR